MPLKKIRYKNLDLLIKKNLSTLEDSDTEELIKNLQAAKARGWLLKSELKEVCYWKSPRAIRHIESNSRQKIKYHTSIAFSTRSEQEKIERLTSLNGVSIPMASSILMLTNPQRYGVIDIRVWQLLFVMGTMRTNPRGVNFNFKEWYRLLVILRYFSKKHRVSVRDIERTIFLVHQKYQDGLLYQK